MPTRNYKNAPSHTIPGGVANGSTTSIVVDSVVGWPTSFPFTVIIEPDTALEEICDVSNVVGTTLTVTRGVDGSTASAHAAGSKIAHGYTARDATEANAHINATSGVHGATGSLVDTGSVQTIAGAKTFSAAAQHNGALNGAAGGTLNGSFTFGSPPTVDGALLRNLDPTRQVFTANGTWTKPAGLKYIEVEVVGAGGAGGGAGAPATQSAVGGGGGGGGYAKKLILAAALGASESVAVGVGGTVGAAGNNPGSNGGNSSFGTVAILTGTGGTGGTGMAGTSNDNRAGGGAGGTATGGDINISGERGTEGRVSNTLIASSSVGGSSVLGPGGGDAAAVNTSAGTAGGAYGGGGSGGMNRTGGAGGAVSGGAGADGVVIVTNYFGA